MGGGGACFPKLTWKKGKRKAGGPSDPGNRPWMQKRLVKRPSIVSGDKEARVYSLGSIHLEHLSAVTTSLHSTGTRDQATRECRTGQARRYRQGLRKHHCCGREAASGAEGLSSGSHPAAHQLRELKKVTHWTHPLHVLGFFVVRSNLQLWPELYSGLPSEL